MRDKRPVDELSIAELERILALRKREARQARVQRFEARRGAVPLAAIEADESIVLSPNHQEAALRPALKAVPNKPHNPLLADSIVTTDTEPQFEDEFGFTQSSTINGSQSRRRVWLNRSLTVVEIAAVGGLAFLLISLFTSLQAVAQTTADIQTQYQLTLQASVVLPTATPAINIASVVLPGGHVYDATNNTARFNLDEVPAAYRDAYQKQVLNFVPTAQPSPSPGEPLSIRIPTLNIAAAVVGGDSWDNLQRGVGHHVGSANPGELGNMVLAGHDDVYGSLFKDLDKLRPGDEVIVTTQLRTFTYVVQAHEIVGPTETRVMDNSRRDAAQITLITCYPYQVDTRRYVVYGVLKVS